MRKGVRVLIYFMSLFLVFFLGRFLLQGNWEFVGYSLISAGLLALLIWSNKYYEFPVVVFWFFALWIIMHMLGGGVFIGETKLYDFLLLNVFDGGGEFVILKYDQFVHAYCYFAISILLYFILKKHMKKGHDVALVVFTILAAIGVGLLNEVVEFFMVVFAGAAEAVGGYYNTALDLVFNLIGGIVGAFFAWKFLDK